MKRKSFVSILIVLLALFSLTRCKLAEVETIDEIPCPGVGIDTVIIPGWDNQPNCWARVRRVTPNLKLRICCAIRP